MQSLRIESMLCILEWYGYGDGDEPRHEGQLRINIGVLVNFEYRK